MSCSNITKKRLSPLSGVQRVRSQLVLWGLMRFIDIIEGPVSTVAWVD